ELQVDIKRDRPFERIELTGLAEDDVGALLDSLFGWSPPADVARELQSETRGNPFFLEELAQHFKELGIVSARDRLSSMPITVAELGVPEGVKDLLGRRLQRLSEPAFHALAAAAVIGAEFGLDVLGYVVGTGEDRLVELLDEAVAARLLVEVPGQLGS